MKIIGVGGTNGSGKDVLSQIMADDYGWFFVSVSRDLFIPELDRRGEPTERANMAALTAEWRRQSGMGAVIDKAIEYCKSADKKYAGLVISSLRHPGEADRIHELGGKVVWIDADPHVRYERIYKRGQGDKDKKTFEQFFAEEKREMYQSGDSATLQTAAVKDTADIFIQNDTNDFEAFKQKVKQALSL